MRETHDASDQLKGIHDRIKVKILRKVSFPNYVHGSLPNRADGSSRSHIANARAHSRQRLIFTADIKNYYPSITATQVRSVWLRFFRFAPTVADLLTALTTYQNQLPQGWKCSSYIAHLVFHDVEHLLFAKLQDQGFRYTRLMDDINISGKKSVSQSEVSNLFSTIIGMLLTKGTKPNRKKTKLQSRSCGQRVNKLNVSSARVTNPRTYRKNLRARLHQFRKSPPSDPMEHKAIYQSIRGQISYIRSQHPREAAKLLEELGRE